jgi:flagellar motor switch protein FliM
LAHSQQQATQAASGKPPSVQPCNFRSAGRITNENARALTAIHEIFARQLTSALDVYMGGDLKVKLQGVDQLSVKEHIPSVAAFSYLAPFSVSSSENAVVVEIDVELVLPMIDLLLGGPGGPVRELRELSEIEEEIMQELATVIARQAEAAWGMPAMSLTANRHIEPEGLGQYCPPTEKLTVVKLEIEVGSLTGAIQLAFSASLATLLVKQSQLDKPGKKNKLRQFPSTNLRERILDCDFNVAADLPGMRVSVRDLIGLQPGCVLKLRAPVRNPGMLTVGGREIFEAVPVRNGAQKAAQVGRRVQLTGWGKE